MADKDAELGIDNKPKEKTPEQLAKEKVLA